MLLVLCSVFHPVGLILLYTGPTNKRRLDAYTSPSYCYIQTQKKSQPWKQSKQNQCGGIIKTLLLFTLLVSNQWIDGWWWCIWPFFFFCSFPPSPFPPSFPLLVPLSSFLSVIVFRVGRRSGCGSEPRPSSDSFAWVPNHIQPFRRRLLPTLPRLGLAIPFRRFVGFDGSYPYRHPSPVHLTRLLISFAITLAVTVPPFFFYFLFSFLDSKAIVVVIFLRTITKNLFSSFS